MANFYYLYETTNLTNGKKYIGQHCTHNMNDGYYGSCKQIIKDIKNGDKYTVRILKQFTNIFDLGKAEYEEIKCKKAVKNPNYYNTSNGVYYNYCFEYGRSQEVKDKISKNCSYRNPEVIEKIRNKAIGRPQPGRKRREKGEWSPSEKTRENMSKAKIGKIPWNKGLTKEDSRVAASIINFHGKKRI